MGLRHGLGCAVFPDGARYAGEWSEGYMDGWGTYTWPAPGGASYVGSFRANERAGLGIVTHADRRRDAGVWRAGRIETPMTASCGGGDDAGGGRGEGSRGHAVGVRTGGVHCTARVPESVAPVVRTS